MQHPQLCPFVFVCRSGAKSVHLFKKRGIGCCVAYNFPSIFKNKAAEESPERLGKAGCSLWSVAASLLQIDSTANERLNHNNTVIHYDSLF